MENRLLACYPNQMIKHFTATHLYVVDYTEYSKAQKIKRSVECHSVPPKVEAFTIHNYTDVVVAFAPFTNKTFVDKETGDPLSQCECVFFPDGNVPKCWVLFLELKYNNPANNARNITKAKSQLVKTLSYYWEKGVVNSSNISYLIVCIPKARIPFKSFYVAPSEAIPLKRRFNASMYGALEVEVKGLSQIKVYAAEQRQRSPFAHPSYR